jgi:hypothetical protein
MSAIEPGRRLPDAEPNMSTEAAAIAVSEMTGIPLERLKSFILAIAAVPEPEVGTPDMTEMSLLSPAGIREQAHMLRVALTDLEALIAGGQS